MADVTNGHHSRSSSKSLFKSIVSQAYDQPPSYVVSNTKPSVNSSYCRHRGWSRQCWLILIACILTVSIIIIVVVALLVTRANRYPDYSQLVYRLTDTYSGESFFDKFNYFYGYDPAQGFVHYTDQAAALSLNLTYATSSSAILRVDTSDTDSTTGRKSVRVESKTTYDNGLFIFDVIHSPYGCSTWPALWMTNRYFWPEDGEIDIMEAANTATIGNQVTLHTTNHCSMSVKRKETGKALHTNCYNATNDNAGCGVRGATSTFGEEFNSNGGGVYAMEWRDAGIRTWFFDRGSLPTDLSAVLLNNGTSSTPDPSKWTTPLADFPNTDCDISSHFRNQSIIANIDLCGQWAGASEFYTEQSGCPGTCVDYVSEQPGSAYNEAYWEFGGWWVFSAV